MSQVNKTFYPDRTTSLSGIQLTSTRLTDIVTGPWDESIAISQSNSEEYAPFCNLHYFAWYNNELLNRGSTPYTQKIAMLYTQDYNNMARYQMYNGSVTYTGSTFNIGQLNDAPYNMYSITGDTASKGTWTVNLVATMQSHYDLNKYFIITGANLQKILGVVCVGFTDNSYCSLKYYEDNKTGTLASKTPQCLFMVGIIDNDGSGKQTFNGINFNNFDYEYWQITDGNLTTGKWNKCNITQMPILPPYSIISGSRNIGPTENGTICMPLIACMGGGSMNFTNYWSSKPAAGSVVVGGKFNEDYTMVLDGTTFAKPIITQAGMDKAFKAAATYGIPFTNEFPATMHNMYDDTTITTFMPVANDGGYYNGSYEVLTVNGNENPDLSLNNKIIWNGGKDAPYNNRTYDPNADVSLDEIEPNAPTINALNLFNKTYVLNKLDVEAFRNYLFYLESDQDHLLTELFNKSIQMFGGGIDAIASLKMFPLDVKALAGATNLDTLIMGVLPFKDSNDDPIQGYTIPDNMSPIVDLGYFDVKPEFNSFLDYAPYTSIGLYIPYVGLIELDPALYMNHRVSVKMIIDISTGTCTAMVYKDDNYITYHTGVVGIEVPITAPSAQNTDRIMQGQALSAGATALGLIGAAAGAPMAAVGAMAGLTAMAGKEISNYDRVSMNGGQQASPSCGLYAPNKCYIVIARPKIALDTVAETNQYNKEVGFAMNKPTTMYDYLQSLGTVNGATISGTLADHVDYQSYTGNLTPDELEEVSKLVAEGIKFGILIFPNS